MLTNTRVCLLTDVLNRLLAHCIACWTLPITSAHSTMGAMAVRVKLAAIV
jgi:hypothetical protein